MRILTLSVRVIHCHRSPAQLIVSDCFLKDVTKLDLNQNTFGRLYPISYTVFVRVRCSWGSIHKKLAIGGSVHIIII